MNSTTARLAQLGPAALVGSLNRPAVRLMLTSTLTSATDATIIAVISGSQSWIQPICDAWAL
jgi:hypothetical protein